MLKQIKSKVFRESPIEFHKGLNVVLGDSQGTNSIGKSTLLMIVDFVFGGNSYITENKDTVKYLGNHMFEFILEFCDKEYYFRRGTEDSTAVEECDEKFSTIKNWSLSEYTNFLHKMYMEDLNLISFRSAVGVFSRIAQKNNFFLSKPLKVVMNSKEKDCITNIIKLFDYYARIEKVEKEIDKINSSMKAIRNADKFNYLNKINKTQYKKNSKYIKDETNNLNTMAIQMSFKINKSISERYQELQDELSKMKIEKNILINKLKRINRNIKNNSVVKKKDFKLLKDFFNEVNLEKLEEIENFHQTISGILKDDLLKAQLSIKNRLVDIEKEISDLEKSILNITVDGDVPREIINPLIEKVALINTKKQENSIYELYKSKGDKKKEKIEQLSQSKENIVNDIQKLINDKMKVLNGTIYGFSNKTPKFELTQSTHSLILPDNTGTAREYANLIIFDISVLMLTKLPFIIHDSVIFKNIGNLPMSQIINIYNEQAKQCFISIDEVTKFSEECKNILYDKKVIQLSNKKTLFIKDWTTNNSLH